MKAFTTGWRKPRPVATVAMARQSRENFRLRGKKKLGQILNLEYSVNLKIKINTNANDSGNGHQAGIFSALGNSSTGYSALDSN